MLLKHLKYGMAPHVEALCLGIWLPFLPQCGTYNKVPQKLKEKEDNLIKGEEVFKHNVEESKKNWYKVEKNRGIWENKKPSKI